MGKMLDLKLDIDHRLLSLVNWARAFKASLSLTSSQKKALESTGRKFNGAAKGDKILICGNGPSLDELDFGQFHNVPTVTANFFYKHKSAEALNPEYYVIIDGKIMSGIWPVHMIDEIFEKFPSVELFLDVRWMESSLLAPYRKLPNLNWILPNFFPHANLQPRLKVNKPICGLNVVASAIGISTAMGYKKLGIAGVDGDGLFREILDRPSHFYEGQKDVSMSSFDSMVKSLVLSAENLWAWQGIVKTHKAKDIHLTNLCKGGIMDCMPRQAPSDFLK